MVGVRYRPIERLRAKTPRIRSRGQGPRKSVKESKTDLIIPCHYYENSPSKTDALSLRERVRVRASPNFHSSCVARTGPSAIDMIKALVALLRDRFSVLQGQPLRLPCCASIFIPKRGPRAIGNSGLEQEACCVIHVVVGFVGHRSC